MPDFTYTSLSLQTGQRKHGTLSAANKEEAEKKVKALFPAGSGEINVVFIDLDAPDPIFKTYRPS